MKKNKYHLMIQREEEERQKEYREWNKLFTPLRFIRWGNDFNIPKPITND